MAETSTSPSFSWLGRAGTCLSLACAIHCMAAPLLLAVLPVIGLGFILGEGAEGLLLAMAVLLASASLCWGFRVHRRSIVFAALGAAVALIAVGKFGAEEGAGEVALVVIGSIGLAAAQLLNRRLCRSCAHCQTGAPRA